MDTNYSYYNTSKGYKVVGGTAAQFLKADGSVDNLKYVTLNTPQTIEAIKAFAGAFDNTYLGAAIMINGGGNSNTVFPTLALHQPGLYAGTISYRNDVEFSFMNINGDSYKYVRAAGFIKEGSDGAHLLSGDGSHIHINTFASVSSLQSYVDKTSTESVGGIKRLTGAYTSWLYADDNNNALGFAQSLGDQFAIGTLNNEDFSMYHNGNKKVVVTNTYTEFLHYVKVPNGVENSHAVNVNQLNNYAIPKTHPVNAITQNNINDWANYKGYADNRNIAPNSLGVNQFQFGFTNWYNNFDQESKYADYIHFGGFLNGSGGNQNLIMFKKNGKGIRQYQGSAQSVSPYSSYVEYWHTDALPQANVDYLAYLVNAGVVTQGDITSAINALNISQYVTQTTLNSQLAASLNGYATQSFVQSLGYLTAAALNGYATQAWVGQQGYLTASNLNGYATQAWVQSLGYLTAAALNGYATQSYVGQTFIPQTHPVNNITQTNINTWNNIAGYAHQHSNYPLLEVVNQELATNSEVDFEKVIVQDYVKAHNNFMSANEDPNTMFIPDGNTATIRDEIVNEDYQIRLNPNEYYIDSSGLLEMDDRNRLIHVIGDQIKMVVNLKEIYRKQQYVIYNFDQEGNSMKIEVQGNHVTDIEPGCFQRFYVTESLRVIAERQQPCNFIW